MTGRYFWLFLYAHAVVATWSSDNWEAFQDKCYLFGQNKANWTEAATQCESLGAQLPQIDNAELDTWLVDHVTNHSIVALWLGGSSQATVGYWEWLPSKEPIKNYVNWGHGSPNNPITERCLQMWTGVHFKWNDAVCNRQRNFACQKTASHCPDGWQEFHHNCYLFEANLKSWTDAAQHCNNLGARLPQIENTELDVWLLDQIKRHSLVRVWLGGSSQAKVGVWEWLPSGKPFGNYTNWAPGEPNYPDGSRCLELIQMTMDAWNNNICRLKQPFVCQKPATCG